MRISRITNVDRMEIFSLKPNEILFSLFGISIQTVSYPALCSDTHQLTSEITNYT